MFQIIFVTQHSHVLYPSCQASRFILGGHNSGPLTSVNLFPGLQYLTCVYPSICFQHWDPSLREGLLCLQPTQGDQLRKEGKGAFVKASQGIAPLVAGVLWKASFDNQDTQGLKDQSSPFSLSCCRHKVIRYQKIVNKTSMAQDIYMLSLS